MPFKVIKRTGKRPFKIIKTTTGKTVGTSTTREAAKKSVIARNMADRRKS